ncbi:MAG: hypothetical protein Q9166_005784 [cf. Caloplaca sp. 2 TL-2023]
MNLVKAFKTQAEEESKTHIDNFKSIMITGQDDLASLLEERADAIMQQEKQIARTTVEMLFPSDAGQPGQSGQTRTVLTQCMAQSVAEAILRSLNRLLAAYDETTSEGPKNERQLLLVRPSKKDEELLEAILQSHYEKGKQRLDKLLFGESKGSAPTSKDDIGMLKGHGNWWFPKGKQSKFSEMIDEEEGTWYSVTRSAGKGVRRIVGGFPNVPKGQ